MSAKTMDKSVTRRQAKSALLARLGWLVAALGLALGAHAAPPPGHSPRAVPEEIVLRGTDSEGNELALRVPVNILMARPGGLAQLQQPGNNANINLNQIGGSSVSSSLYDSGNTALKVNCIVGCSAGGSFTDNSAFTTGSTSVTNVSGLFNDTATNLTSGNAGAIRATTDRMLFVNIGKIGGTVPGLTGSSLNVNCTGGCSGGAGFTDNSAFTAGTTAETNVGGVFNDGLTALTSGNAAAARITPNRGVHANLRNNAGTEIATSANPLRVDPTGTTTQPVSGAVTANAGSGTFTVGGTVTANQGTANATPWNQNIAQVGGNTVSTAATGTMLAGMADGTGNKLTTNSTTTASKFALDENIISILGTAPTTAGFLDIKGADGNVFVRQATAANLNATAVQGNAGSNAQAWWTRIGDATNGPAAVKAASTAAVAADPALVVAVSPNNAVAATQSGTWTVQQGGAPWSVTGTKTNNNAAPGATNIGDLPAIANAATQSWTEGNQVAESVDLSGRQRVRGTTSDNGAAATSDLQGVAPSIYQTDYLNGTAATQGRNGATSQGTDGLLWVASLPSMRPASFHAITVVASAASATDIFVMPGNASNTVLVTRVEITCQETTAGQVLVSLLRRSTADSAGTTQSVTTGKDDTNTAAAVSAPVAYTANPTKGTLSEALDAKYLGCMASGTAAPDDILIEDWWQKPQVLRGTAQQIAVNLGAWSAGSPDGTGTTVTGGSFAIKVSWIETKTITP